MSKKLIYDIKWELIDIEQYPDEHGVLIYTSPENGRVKISIICSKDIMIDIIEAIKRIADIPEK